MIIHIDMDAFYASIETRDRPELADRPVIVGGSPDGRGVVAAANYVARQYGIHSAMPAATAKRLCPEAVFLPVRMGHYSDVGEQIRAIFQRYTPVIEPLSLDEAFLDVGASEKLFGSTEAIARRIKQDIHDELNLIASVGVAPNKFLAKIASDLEKPDGFVIVTPDRVRDFLDPLPVSRIWGVGKVTGAALQDLGIRTVGELGGQPLERLIERFGKHGEHLWQLAHGVDARAVIPDHQAKSISHEITFDQDIHDLEALRSILLALTEQVGQRLRRNDLLGRTVFLKIRFNDFKTVTRSSTLRRATDVTRVMWKSADAVLRKTLGTRHRPLRLIGMGMNGLETKRAAQQDLFADPQDQRQRRIDQLGDQLRERFGPAALRRGRSVK